MELLPRKAFYPWAHTRWRQGKKHPSFLYWSYEIFGLLPRKPLCPAGSPVFKITGGEENLVCHTVTLSVPETAQLYCLVYTAVSTHARTYLWYTVSVWIASAYLPQFSPRPSSRAWGRPSGGSPPDCSRAAPAGRRQSGRRSASQLSSGLCSCHSSTCKGGELIVLKVENA